jgi:hypothetical protein
MRNVLGGLATPVPHGRLAGSAEALRPATALPVTLGGRDSTGYYGLSAPLLVLAISRPTLLGTSQRFRRCSHRNYWLR